jgi:hypothetical protein
MNLVKLMVMVMLVGKVLETLFVMKIMLSSNFLGGIICWRFYCDFNGGMLAAIRGTLPAQHVHKGNRHVSKVFDNFHNVFIGKGGSF